MFSDINKFKLNKQMSNNIMYDSYYPHYDDKKCGIITEPIQLKYNVLTKEFNNKEYTNKLNICLDDAQKSMAKLIDDINSLDNILTQINKSKDHQFIPTLKKRKTDDDKSNSMSYLNIKLKTNYQTKDFETKIVKGSIVNNYFNEKQTIEVKNGEDFVKHIGKNKTIRLYLNFAVRFDKNKSPMLRAKRFYVSIYCSRIEIIENEYNDNKIYQLKDCKTIKIGGENKNVFDCGNGVLKIVDEPNKYNYYNYTTNIIKPTKKNIKNSNDRIIDILNKN